MTLTHVQHFAARMLYLLPQTCFFAETAWMMSTELNEVDGTVSGVVVAAEVGGGGLPLLPSRPVGR